MDLQTLNAIISLHFIKPVHFILMKCEQSMATHLVQHSLKPQSCLMFSLFRDIYWHLIWLDQTLWMYTHSVGSRVCCIWGVPNLYVLWLYGEKCFLLLATEDWLSQWYPTHTLPPHHTSHHKADGFS